MKLTDALRAEHVVFHTLFQSLDDLVTGGAAEVRVAARLLSRLMAQHGEAEDRLLLPVLEPYIEHIGQLDSFHEEHEIIDENLARLEGVAEDAEAMRLLRHTVQLAREHFDKEERVVFALAEEHVSVQSLEELGRQWERMKDVAPGRGV